MVSFHQGMREPCTFSPPEAQIFKASNFPQVLAPSLSSFLPPLAVPLCRWLVACRTGVLSLFTEGW